jgi:hypothetical protein
MTTFLKSRWFCALPLAFVVSACGGASEEEQRAFFEQSYETGQLAYDVGAKGLEQALDAVVAASRSAGRRTTRGTLRRLAGNQMRYTPSEENRLRVESKEDWVELRFGDLRIRGEDTETAIRSDHDIEIRVTDHRGSNFLLNSRKRRRVRTLSIKGTVFSPTVDRLVEVNLRSVGDEYFDHGGGGTGYEHRYRLEGTVIDRELRASHEVNETWEFQLQASGNDSAQSSVRTMNNTSTFGDSIFLQWKDVGLYKNFRSRRGVFGASDDAFWRQTGGEIFQNLFKVGEVKVKTENFGGAGWWVKFVLESLEGEEALVLEELNARTGS